MKLECGEPGPDGLRCLLPKGHRQKKHRAVKIIQWESSEGVWPNRLEMTWERRNHPAPFGWGWWGDPPEWKHLLCDGYGRPYPNSDSGKTAGRGRRRTRGDQASS